MSAATDRSAPWGAAGASLIAKWLPREESAATIAERTDALVFSVGIELGINEWFASNGTRWKGDLAAIVEAHAVFDDLGSPDPAYGYTLTLLGASDTVRLTIRVKAGSQVAGRRAPNNRITVEVNELLPGALTAHMADLFTETVVCTWQPTAVAFRNDELIEVSSRSGWAIPIGYRTWVADSVGEVNCTNARVTTRRLENGTFLATPDAWAASEVASAMLEVFQANNLDKIPH